MAFWIGVIFTKRGNEVAYSLLRYVFNEVGTTCVGIVCVERSKLTTWYVIIYDYNYFNEVTNDVVDLFCMQNDVAKCSF